MMLGLLIWLGVWAGISFERLPDLQIAARPDTD